MSLAHPKDRKTAVPKYNEQGEGEDKVEEAAGAGTQNRILELIVKN